MQKKKTSWKKEKKIVQAKVNGTEKEGLIVAHFGNVVEIEDDSGNMISAHLRKNAEPCITGDKVLWREEGNNIFIVVQVLPRFNELVKPEKTNKTKLIAANISTIVIVAAPKPLYSRRLIDRYIVAAELLNIRPVILFNKIDLLEDDEFEEVQDDLSIYENIGYEVIYSCAVSSKGLKQIIQSLHNKSAILVGMSGVGKSSIIKALTENESVRVGEVSELTNHGKHTTTTTRLYRIPGGGSLIDSPGVREFVLTRVEPGEVIKGFVEFYEHSGQCKFRNCQHKSEPECALLKAFAENKICAERWHSYHEILDEMVDG